MLCIGIDLLSEPRTVAGTGTYARNLIGKLANLDGKNRYFVFINRGAWQTFFIRHPHFTFIPYTFPVGSSVVRRTAQQILLAACNRYQLDILHSVNNVLPLTYRGRCVVTIHDLAAYAIKQRYNHLKNMYLKLFTALSVRKADRVIAVSTSTAKDIEHYLGPTRGKVIVIPNGVAEIFRPLDQKEAMELVAKWGLKRRFILYVGRLERGKNLTTLLRAYSRLGQDLRSLFKLVLVGPPGDAYRDLNVLAKKLGVEGDLVFTGYVSGQELVAFYSLARVFVMTSLYEGFGLPLIEAMACGAAIIAAETSSIPEVVERAGLFVKPYDVDGLSQRIAKICQDDNLWECLRKLGFEKARKFSWEATARETLKVYEEVC